MLAAEVLAVSYTHLDVYKRQNQDIGYMPQTRSTLPGSGICGFDVLANAARGHRCV